MDKKSSILIAISLVITGFATLVLGNYLIFFMAVATNPDWDGLQASSNITFTGNVSSNESVNFTYNGITTSFCYKTTTSNPWCSNIVNAIDTNTSIIAASNLTAAINANATVRAYLIASDVTNITVLKYITVGRAGNSIPLSMNESITNGVFSSETLIGGKDIVYGQSATINYASIVMPLMGLLLMIAGLVFLLLEISGIGIGNNNKNESIKPNGGTRMLPSNRGSREASSGNERE